MGTNVQTRRFTRADYDAFTSGLRRNLQSLTELLERPGFGVGNASLGAELELSLVNRKGETQWINQQLLELANDPLLALEINRYNLEYNLAPIAAAGKPFSQMAQAIEQKINAINQLAKPLGAEAVTIGILPTLNKRDISPAAMTDNNRYHVLNNALKKLRGHDLEVDIEGPEPLKLSLSNLNIEGANTSFQVHLRVNPEQFANCYNAAQLGTAATLAISANSPLLLGHRLWQETRVILFKQSVESRNIERDHYIGPSRAGLGNCWINNSAIELFAASVRDYPILIPEHREDIYQPSPTAGDIPDLADLRMHHGSIWHWNRAIYDPSAGGHLRIELRAMPSGPTSLDMAANAAFSVGITQGLAASMPAFTRQLDFSAVQQNFYAAAKHGLDAEFLWPRKTRATAAPLKANKVIKKLITIAAAGLAELGVEQAEIDNYLGIIDARLTNRQTGATWQLATLTKLEQQHARPQALQHMLQLYIKNCASGQPVHCWNI